MRRFKRPRRPISVLRKTHVSTLCDAIKAAIRGVAIVGVTKS